MQGCHNGFCFLLLPALHEKKPPRLKGRPEFREETPKAGRAADAALRKYLGADFVPRDNTDFRGPFSHMI
jgi:hypothetical protein